MARRDSEENRSVALYWDFENLHAGLAEAKFGEGFCSRPDNRFKPQEALIDIQAIVEFASCQHQRSCRDARLVDRIDGKEVISTFAGISPNGEWRRA